MNEKIIIGWIRRPRPAARNGAEAGLWFNAGERIQIRKPDEDIGMAGPSGSKGGGRTRFGSRPISQLHLGATELINLLSS